MRHSLTLDRRHMLTTLAAIAAPLRGAAAQAQQPGLLVASPPGARLDRWAEPLANTIGRAMPSRTPLVRQNVGGLDGVTGANTFEARGEPDGRTALLVPGATSLSWLVGESRAKFDLGNWLPIWAATMPCVMVSRVQLTRGRSLNFAAAGPTGPELPFLLALDLFGVDPVLTSAAEADAVLLTGAGLPDLVQSASASGMNPVLTLGLPGLDGTLARDPVLPTLPTTMELAADRTPPGMAAALLAVSLAGQLDAAMVLQQLTPAATLAAWRRACQPAVHDPDIVSESARLGARMMSTNAAGTLMGRIAGNGDVLLTLRRWLATRYGWRPT